MACAKAEETEAVKTRNSARKSPMAKLYDIEPDTREGLEIVNALADLLDVANTPNSDAKRLAVEYIRDVPVNPNLTTEERNVIGAFIRLLESDAKAPGT
jgi:hypothetical protein